MENAYKVNSNKFNGIRNCDCTKCGRTVTLPKCKQLAGSNSAGNSVLIPYLKSWALLGHERAQFLDAMNYA